MKLLLYLPLLSLLLVFQFSFAQISWNTTLVSHWANDTCMAVDVFNDFAYVLNNEGILRIIDVSDPTNPIERGFFDSGGDVYRLSVSGSLVLLAEREVLHFINVSDPVNPTEIGFFDTQGGIRDVTMNSHYAYVAHGSLGSLVGWGLQIIDISDPGNSAEVGFFDTGVQAVSVSVNDTIAYVGSGDYGLWIIDISNPANPTEITRWIGDAAEVLVRDNYAFVAVGYPLYGLQIIDVSDPTNPIETGFFDAEEGIGSLAVAYNYVYYVMYLNGLRIIDVADPTNPFETGFYNNGEIPYRDVAVQNNLAYLTEYSNGLYVIRNDLITSIVEDKTTQIPDEYVLHQNYPNPFNPNTKIKYSVPQSSNVVIKVFDVLGNEIETLVNEEKPIGTYELNWYAESLPSGIYFYRIQTGSFIETKKMVLLR